MDSHQNVQATEVIIFESAKRIYHSDGTFQPVTLKQFEKSIKAWWQGEVLSIQRDDCVTLTVPKSENSEKCAIEENRKRLQANEAPAALLRATFPPLPGQYLFQVIKGPAFDSAQRELEQCYGRNRPLGLWPSEFANVIEED